MKRFWFALVALFFASPALAQVSFDGERVANFTSTTPIASPASSLPFTNPDNLKYYDFIAPYNNTINLYFHIDTADVEFSAAKLRLDFFDLDLKGVNSPAFLTESLRVSFLFPDASSGGELHPGYIDSITYSAPNFVLTGDSTKQAIEFSGIEELVNRYKQFQIPLVVRLEIAAHTTTVVSNSSEYVAVRVIGTEAPKPIYSISGTVFYKDGTTPMANATVEVGSKVFTTGANGQYSISQLITGAHTVLASRNGFTFSNNPRAVTIGTTSLSGINFIAATEPTYQITGTVRHEGTNTAVSGSGILRNGTQVTVSNASGQYTLTGVSRGNYTITASFPNSTLLLSGFTNPVTILDANRANINFLVRCNAHYTFDGTSCAADRDPITLSASDSSFTTHVLVTWNKIFHASQYALYRSTSSASLGSLIATVTTDSYSDTSATAGVQYYYTVIGKKDGTNFVQSNRDAGSRAITPTYSVSGIVYYSDGKTPMANATVQIGGKTFTTGANGQFTITQLLAGEHTAQSSRNGFTFANSPRTIKIGSTNLSGINFIAATEPTYSVVGIIRHEGDFAAVPGAKVQRNGTDAATSNANGQFTISGLQRGSHTFTGTFPNSEVLPNGFTNPVAILDSNIISVNFLVRCLENFTFDGTSCAADRNPISLTATDGTFTTHVRITWNTIVHATAYDVFRSTINGELGSLLATVTDGSFDDTTATPGITYYYTVIAKKDGSNFVTSNTDAGQRAAVVVDEPCTEPGAIRDANGNCVVAETPDETLRSPVYTKYNTFLSQWNFLELIASGSQAIDAKVTVYRIDGSTIRVVNVRIEPQQQIDLDIHGIVGMVDTYGLVKIEFNSQQNGASLLGRMTMYRKNPGRDDYSFAFARELSNAVAGKSYASANSYDPQGRGYLVPNWMEITNLDSKSRSFTHRVFDQAGTLVQEKTFTIAPFGQFDVNAGHEFGEGVYLNEVNPHSAKAPYLAAVSRYSSNQVGGSEAATYNFAFSLQAKQGLRDNQYLAISNDVGACWSQTNWVEVVNVLNKPANATVVFRNADGEQVAKDTITLDPRSQFHFNASAILDKATSGSVSVKSDVAGALITQGLVYYHDCKDNTVQTAYATVGKRPNGKKQIGSINTNLGMRNVISLIPIAKASFDTTLRLQTIEQSESVILTTGGGFSVEQVSLDNGGALPVGDNLYGTLAVETPLEGQIIAEALRIRERADGGIDFVIPTMVK